MKRMKRLLYVSFAMLLLVGCGGATVGGSSTAGSTGSGVGKASIDLTVSGGVEGKSTQLAKYDCGGGSFGTYQTELVPVINGQQYTIDLLISKYKGAPVTYNLPAPDNNVGLSFGTDQKDWFQDSHTTGSVTINAGEDSGAVDAHFDPPAYTGFVPLDVKFTFTCPSKH